ncbi:MAG: extracellular solute-binding protein [Chloroflexota bacterium]|nr:extracellular solute-binding protein [Chloroflexota bacterium]
MTRSKLWILLAIILVAAMVLGACGGKDEPSEQVQEKVEEVAEKVTEKVEEAKEEAPTAKPSTQDMTATADAWAEVDPSGQTVFFWHQHTRGREEALQEIVQEFNDSNEYGIEVVAEYQGGYGDIFNKMLTFMNTEDAPNLVVAYQNQAATYQLGDSLIDMTDLVDSAKWGYSAEEQRDFFSGFYGQDIFPNFGNARLGFPPNRSMEVMYYNMDWLKELGYDAPPATPEEFKEMACAASASPYSGASTDVSPIGYELSVDASRFASWTFARGGDVFDYEDGQYDYNNEAAVAAMSFLQELFEEGCATIVTERYGDQTDFGQGRLLFTVGSSSGLPYYRSAVEEGANFNWSVAPIPYTTGEPVQNIYGASVSIPKTTPDAELAAWLFLKHYTSPDVQAKWVEASNYFPVRSGVAEGLDDYFAENPAYQTAFELLPYGTFEPPAPGYDFVRDMAEEAMAAIAGGAPVQETLDQLTEDANASLAEQLEQIPESPDALAKIDPSGQTVFFWHQHTRDRETALQEIVQEFNDTNKYGIEVVAEYQGGYGDIFNKMLTFMNTEDAPNLVVAYQNQAATYQLGDALVDMTPYVESIKYGLNSAEQKDFFSGFFNQDIFPNFGNARLGFPPNRSMEVMYYNMDWLKELGYDAPPATPEEFKEMACAASASPYSGASTDVSPIGYELSVDASRFASWTFARGGDVFDYEDGQYDYNNEAAVAAMSFLQELFEEGCATIVTERYGDQTDFGQGRLLFTVGSSSGLPYYRSAVEEGANFNWSVAPIPYTTEEPAQNIYGASVSIPKTTSEQQLAAWLFLKHYTSPDVQAKWAQASNYFPVRASVAEGLDDYFAENPAYQTAFELLPYGTFEPPAPGYDFVRDMAEEAMAAIAGGAPVQETLDQLTEDANASLAEQLEQIQ